MSERQREILILFSHRKEQDSCLDILQTSSYLPFRSELIGIGPREAGERTLHLLEKDSNRAVLLLGSAGWIKPSGYPRVPVWANQIVSESGKRIRPTLRVPAEWIEGQGWATASLVTVSRPVLDEERAEQLRERVQADMVDMESYAVLQACASRRVPCGVVRVITDQANTQTREDYWHNLVGAMGELGNEISSLVSWLHREDRLRLEQED